MMKAGEFGRDKGEIAVMKLWMSPAYWFLVSLPVYAAYVSGYKTAYLGVETGSVRMFERDISRRASPWAFWATVLWHVARVSSYAASVLALFWIAVAGVEDRNVLTPIAFFLAFGLLGLNFCVCANVVPAFRTGQIDSSAGIVTRSGQPVMFWAVISVHLVFTAIFLFPLILGLTVLVLSLRP